MNRSAPGHDIFAKERTVDVITKENVGFQDLHLSHNVLSGLQKARFERPSPIQLKAIPYGRCGLDLIVQAKSGTGKTCVFTVIALEAISVESSSLQVIVLAPTREIAVQIEDVITAVGQDMKMLKVCAFIGGRPVADDKVNAKGCQIAVGSPGRIFQLIQMDVLKCQNVRVFVLDEADKLLEENFQSQINSIYSMLPPSKQMIAASATYPEELAEFVTRYMRDPTFVRLNPSDMALLGVKQYYHLIEAPADKFFSTFEKKIDAVISLLGIYPFQQALIFSNYHSHAKDLSDACNDSGLPATYISGNLEQERRLEAMKMLKDFKCRVLISTDLTARGIDAHNVDLVVNLDVPMDWETYMHRTGRAGRFGSRGAVVSIIMDGKERDALFKIAETCSVSILPISTDAGGVTVGESPSKGGNTRPSQKVKTNVKPDVNHVQTPNAAVVTAPAGGTPKRVAIEENKIVTGNDIPKIPSLPELMSHGQGNINTDEFSYTFSALLDNFLYYKENKSFKQLPRIKRPPKTDADEENVEDEPKEQFKVDMKDRQPMIAAVHSLPGPVHGGTASRHVGKVSSEQEGNVEPESSPQLGVDAKTSLTKNSRGAPVKKANLAEKKVVGHPSSASGAAGDDTREKKSSEIPRFQEKYTKLQSKRNSEKAETTRDRKKEKDYSSSESYNDDSDDQWPEFLLPRFSRQHDNQQRCSSDDTHRSDLEQYRRSWAAYKNWCRYWHNVQYFHLYGHWYQ